MTLGLVTAGESHGPALVAIVTGLPAGLVLQKERIDADLRRRQQGYGRSPRQQLEQDTVEVREGQTLIDLPYPESATARAARDAGATVLDGLDVLVAQGAASFELWTGVSPPVDVMRAAVRLR